MAFLEGGETKPKVDDGLDTSISTMTQAANLWLDICEKEGRDGKDPITPYTLKEYRRRAKKINEYIWPDKPIQELRTSDIVTFRSWLLKNTPSRYRAGCVLSSVYGILQEMSLRDIVASNVATGVSVSQQSRYKKPIEIPAGEDVAALLAAADRLANSDSVRIAKTWQRYRPMLYLLVDSGMRPQELLAVAKSNFKNGGVQIERAIERPGTKISVPKTPAGRRFIDLSPEVYEMVTHYMRHYSTQNKHDLVFAASTGHWLDTDHWRRRAFNVACFEAGLTVESKVNGELILKNKYSPYDMRHYFASLLFETENNDRVNLKRIQSLMGHEKIETTLNTYGHLLAISADSANDRGGSLSRMTRL